MRSAGTPLLETFVTGWWYQQQLCERQGCQTSKKNSEWHPVGHLISCMAWFTSNTRRQRKAQGSPVRASWGSHNVGRDLVTALHRPPSTDAGKDCRSAHVRSQDHLECDPWYCRELARILDDRVFKATPLARIRGPPSISTSSRDFARLCSISPLRFPLMIPK